MLERKEVKITEKEIIVESNIQKKVKVEILGKIIINDKESIEKHSKDMSLSPKDFEELYLVFKYLTGEKCYQNNTVKKIVDLAAQEMDYSEVHSAYIYFNEYEIKDLEAIYDNAVDDCSTIVEDEKELLS